LSDEFIVFTIISLLFSEILGIGATKHASDKKS